MSSKHSNTYVMTACIANRIILYKMDFKVIPPCTLEKEKCPWSRELEVMGGGGRGADIHLLQHAAS